MTRGRTRGAAVSIRVLCLVREAALVRVEGESAVATPALAAHALARTARVSARACPRLLRLGGAGKSVTGVEREVTCIL